MLEKFGFTGEIDLLSIDIDGMDYWVWEAVSACSPRVVAIEYNWLFGAERAVTHPVLIRVRPERDRQSRLSRRLAGRACASGTDEGLSARRHRTRERVLPAQRSGAGHP